MKTLLRSKCLAVLTLCALSMSALAEEMPFRAVREVAVRVVVLPTGDPGLLTLTWPGGMTLSYLTALDTEYTIGEKRVTLKEFRDYLTTISPNSSLLLQIADDKRHVKRLGAPAPRGS